MPIDRASLNILLIYPPYPNTFWSFNYRSVPNYIYSPHYFYKRVVTFVRNYSPPRKNRSKVSLRHIKAVLRSICVLGMRGEEGFYYWKTLSWTSSRRPKLFTMCVGLAIIGCLFKKVFQAQISKSEDWSGRANPKGIKEIKMDAQTFDRKESTRETFGVEETYMTKDVGSEHV
jgi:hypothetical protein